MALQHLRSSTANKRPVAISLADGQLAINTNAASPGIFFTNSSNVLTKVGPIQVGPNAPNSSPAGSSGNAIGEQWLDTSGSTIVIRIWDGSAWRQQDKFTAVAGTAAAPSFTFDGDTNTGIFSAGADQVAITTGGTQRVLVDAAGDATITGHVNIATSKEYRINGTKVLDATSLGSSVLITSTNITDGTIVNADINASAAIAGTKISPDFGSQTIATTGIVSHALGTAGAPTVTFTGDTNTGIFSPGADQLAISTGGSGRLFITATGTVGVGTGSPSNTAGFSQQFQVTGNLPCISIDNTGTGAKKYSLGVNASGAFGIWDNTASTYRIYVTNGGFVGIGTSSPDTLLHLASAGTAILKIKPSSTGAAEVLLDATGSGVSNQISFRANGTDKWVLGGQNIGAASGVAFSLYNYTNSTNAITVDTSSRVGIGTTSPNAIIETSATATGNTVGALLTNRNQSGSADSVSLNFGLGRSVDTLVFSCPAIRYVKEQQWTGAASTVDASLVFATTRDESTTEKARITSSGQLLVGTSSALTGTTGSHPSQYSKLVSLGNSLNAQGSFVAFGYGSAGTGLAAGVDIATINFTDNAAGQFAQIRCDTDAATSAGDFPGRLVFSTTADGASSPTERMRIANTGQINITARAQNSTDVILSINNTTSSDVVFEASAGSVPVISGPMRISKNTTSSRSINASGTVNQNGADYAEYFKKSGDFIVAKGDVLGINANGLLTDVFANAVSYCVKSTDPGLVGGDNWFTEPRPQDKNGQEVDSSTQEFADWMERLELARAMVDRIAFAGRVPVNVMGATPGQYIVPVEAADGGIEGVAKNEADLTLTEYMRAVGKVIAIEDDGRARIIVKVA